MKEQIDNPETAIEKSVWNDEIVYCPDTKDNRDFLYSECEDTVEGLDVIEYWGTLDGASWRVHITIEEA